MEGGIGIFEKFMRQNSLKSIFSGKWKQEGGAEMSPRSIPQLSLIANSVVARCSKILLVPTEELQQNFETELPDHLRKPSVYARNLLEYCSYRTLHVMSQRPDYLANKDFRRLSFDMMLAWETPDAGSDSLIKETEAQKSPTSEDDEGSSIFYTNSISTAVQVDNKKTVGVEAFARIAPACPAVADTITVYNLFDALTRSSNGQLHFLVYDKYIGSLDKVIKNAKNFSTNLELAEGEIPLDVDGTSPTQPVFQHIGVSAWPGRLTLTNYGLYFEPLGVGSYDKAAVYNLEMDLKQVLKRELTGPLGARLFDKAIMYKSISLSEPVVLEFPEFKGHSRRDYWLAVSREVLYVHRFIRKFKLKAVQRSEALSKATLGIFRYRAVREAFHILPSHYGTLLAFNLVEKLPGGDTVLETLSTRLQLLNNYQSWKQDIAVRVSSNPANMKPSSGLAPVSLMTLNKLGFELVKEQYGAEEAVFLVGDVCVGEFSPLELAVKQSKFDSGAAEAAQATVNEVKVDGVDTNIAVMKELVFPIIELGRRIQHWASWEDPFQSTLFVLLTCYLILWGWIKFIVPFIFVAVASFMLWHRYCSKQLEAFEVVLPPNRNAVEQLLALQEAISQFETLIQDGNIVLLKLRSILFAGLPPQATNRVAFLLAITATVVAFIPLKYLVTLAFVEFFTREMPLRKESSNKVVRRLREWWIRIPAAPVQILRDKETKKKR